VGGFHSDRSGLCIKQLSEDPHRVHCILYYEYRRRDPAHHLFISQGRGAQYIYQHCLGDNSTSGVVQNCLAKKYHKELKLTRPVAGFHLESDFHDSLKIVNSHFYFLDPNFWNSPSLLLLFASSVFAVVFFRYLLLSSSYHFITRILVRSTKRKFNRPIPMQWKKEIRWSILSAVVFTCLGGGGLWLYQNGYTRIYDDIGSYPIFYFIISMVLMLISYETYYYWLHRWMHKPGVFRHVHKVHHDSVVTSVFTSFSFHPLEAILQFLFLPVFVMIIPIHIYALGIVLTIWTVSAIINHASVEIFPKRFYRHPVGKWLIGATHHDLHHKEFRTNFGLYFTFWDRWMKTESKNYSSRFRTNTDEPAR
jgi:lathosterol oxidase